VTKARVAAAGVAVVFTAAALLLGGAFRGSSAAAPPPAPAGGAGRLQAGFALGNTAGLIRSLQLQLQAHPQDAHAYGLLGLAYQQRAREIADPIYYTKSEGVLNRALHLAPNDLVATGGLASLALSRHRFRAALALARRVHKLSPTTAQTYGLLGDAELELGHYRQAFQDFDRLARLKPSLAAYSRVSYARELLGRPADALAAMREALDAATGEPEPTAWTRVQLGKLYWSSGRLTAAATQYRAALLEVPGYVYALDALAQVEGARGRLAAAVSLERRAVDETPLPQFVGYLGDLYAVGGRASLAHRQYALIGAIRRLLVANGVKIDLETALFQADHGVRLGQTLALARLAQRERPSIDGDDVLAWTLERNGRCTEALDYSKLALRLGTKDALKFFHRGAIERCLGHRAESRAWFGRALALNPSFSLLWAPVARRALR
jgi:tetratricopeptide (TPR) repeat protein